MACMQQSRKSCTADWGSEMRHERIGYYILNGRIAQYAPGKWTVHGRQKSRTLLSPGGKFIRADTLGRILAHWRSLRRPDKEKHFVKNDGGLYVGEEIDNLHGRDR